MVAAGVLSAALALFVPGTGTGAAHHELPAIIAAQVDSGQFRAAEASIATALAGNGLHPQVRRELEFQRERMRRILLDFTLDADAVKARLRRDIPDLRDDEFAAWDANGLLERQVIDGRVLYFKRSPSNLFRLSDAARARRAMDAKPTDGPMETANAHHREVIDAVRGTGSASVAPRRLQVTQSLTVEADAVPAGETLAPGFPIRVHCRASRNGSASSRASPRRTRSRRNPRCSARCTSKSRPSQASRRSFRSPTN